MSNTIKKNQTADVKTKSGSNYSYKYVDIAQIHDYLQENEMSYYQYIDRIDNDDYIMTVKIIDGKEQPPLRGSRVVDATLFGNDNPAQKQGSALTYARRYSLLMAFGLATEDDDASALNKEVEPTEEDAQNYEFTFGKNKGTKLVDVIENNPTYIDWLVQNSKDEYLLKCIELLTGQVRSSDGELQDRLQLLTEFNKLIIDTKTDNEKLYDYYKVANNTEMTNEQLLDAINTMKKKVK